MSCEFEHADGAYVLGALSPEDRAAFEQHLAGCDACARSVRELAGLPGLLARVPAEVLDPAHRPPPAPDTLLPALVRRARQRQRRRRIASAGLVAASVIAASVAVGVVVHHDGGAGSQPTAQPTAQATAFQPVGAEPISGWVSLTKVGWGTRLDLTCSYAGERDAYPGGWAVSYTMTVVRTDGTTEQVASWRALPGRTMRLSAATATDRAQIARIVVRTAAGQEVLRLVTG